VPLKQGFKGCRDKKEDVLLNVKSYDDRHYPGAMYKRFLNLLYNKMIERNEFKC